MLWSHLLKYVIKTGDLKVIDAGGQTHTFGVAGSRPRAVVRLSDESLHWKLFFNPELHLGESYMDGTLTLEEGSLRDFLSLLSINLAALKSPVPEFVSRLTIPVRQRLQQYNALGQAARNVAPHYDLSDQLYELFLDPDMYYSCAYYTDPANSLARAQQDKVRHLASKLRLERGMKVLDIGSGWGGLALYMAKQFDVEVTGVSLSGEQVKKATQRAKDAGLEGKVTFLQQDVRTLPGTFDRIVSVGMMEHVGVGFYKPMFAKIRDLLKPDGIALIHFIGSLDGPGTTNAWLRKYIFPGGYAPALSEITRVIEKSGLIMTDIEVLRMHYAYTLHDWEKNFQANRAKVRELYDERFCRMWEFYLIGCEMEFVYMGTGVYQIQLSKDILTPPIVRDYMIDRERTL